MLPSRKVQLRFYAAAFCLSTVVGCSPKGITVSAAAICAEELSTSALLAAKDSVPEPDFEFQYTGEAGLTHSIYVFAPKAGRSSANRPGVVFFHGGGWKSGNASAFYRQSRFLSDRGYVVFSADYGLESDGVTPLEALRDAATAWEAVRFRAGEFGVAPDQLSAGGGSAGGHLAASLAIDTALREKPILEKPASLILFNPVIDNGPEGFGHKRVRDYWEQFSPIHNIGVAHPDTLFMMGDGDRLIPLSTARKYCALVRETGAECRLFIDPGHGHAWFNKPGFVATLKQATIFLDERFLPTPTCARDD